MGRTKLGSAGVAEFVQGVAISGSLTLAKWAVLAVAGIAAIGVGLAAMPTKVAEPQPRRFQRRGCLLYALCHDTSFGNRDH